MLLRSKQSSLASYSSSFWGRGQAQALSAVLDSEATSYILKVSIPVYSCPLKELCGTVDTVSFLLWPVRKAA